MAVSGNQNYIIVVGGIDNETAGMIEEYDPYLNKWKTIYNLDKPITCFSTALLDQKLYLFGGMFNNITTNKAWCFDLFTKEFVELPSMQEPKYFATASVVNNAIYIIGGLNSDHKVLDTIEQWDTDRKSWKFLEPMSIKRHSHASVVKDGYIFVIGGNDGENVLKNVEFYSTEKNTWETVAGMQSVRVNLAVVGVNNFLYAIGGSNDSQDLDSAERFNINNNIWEKITPLPCAIRGHSAVGDKSIIICFGDDRSKRVIQYIPFVKVWTELGEMANKRRFYSAFFTNFKLEPEKQTNKNKGKTEENPKLGFRNVKQEPEEQSNKNEEKTAIKISRNFKQEPEEQTNKNEEKTVDNPKLDMGIMTKLTNLFKINFSAHKNTTISENSKTESHKSPDSLSPPASTSVKITKSDNSLNNYSCIQKEILDINREKIAVVGDIFVEDANIVDIYDGKNKSWTLSKNFGFNKCRFASVIVNDSWMIIIGGQNYADQTLTSVTFYQCCEVEYIDLKNGQKHPLTPLNQARQQFSAVTLRRDSSTDVYAIGGFEIKNAQKVTGNTLSSVERWNSETLIWETISPLRVAVDGHSTCVIDDRIYVTVESDSWTKGTQMNHARNVHSSVVFKGKLFVAGGYVTQTDTILDSVEFYDPIANVWTEFTKLPQPASGISLCCFQNKLLCMGKVDIIQRLILVKFGYTTIQIKLGMLLKALT
ncbi:uncharacterized protein LOC143917352 [Arctopsyche grandis]|uniref:uncharacterized protein LOC143917352 n=1 Tax=Arctopsyche grandis TaxID=121162 RepID=UPI00406D693C